jgi:hypothetical protein
MPSGHLLTAGGGDLGEAEAAHLVTSLIAFLQTLVARIHFG